MRSRWLTAVTFALFTIAILGVGATTAFAAPANDNFASAITLTPATSGTISGTNVAATLQTGEVPPAGNTSSIWYKWTAPADDIVSFDTAGSVDGVGDPLPTDVHVYTGTAVSTLVEVPESYFPGDLFPRGHVEVPVKANAPYYIAITSPALADQGPTVLNWQTKGNTGHITGTVTPTAGGALLQTIQVDAYLVGGHGNSLRTVTTGAGGTYDLTGLGTGTYQVRFTDPAPTTYVEEWFDNRIAPAIPTPVSVTNGSTTSGVNAVLDRASSISGTVKVNGAAVQDITVLLLEYSGGLFQDSTTVQTNVGGGYIISGLRPKLGTGNYYLVQFVEPFASGFPSQLFNQKTSTLLADQLMLPEGTALGAVDAVWPFDLTAPTTTATSVPASQTADGWKKGPVSVTFSAVDQAAGRGVSKTKVSVDSTGPVEFAPPSTIVISKEGATSISYWSIDGANNAETPKPLTFKTDSTKPVTTSDAVANYFAGSSTITLNPSDVDGSGVLTTQWQITGTLAASGSGTSVTVPSTVGSYVLSFWSTDKVGNAETVKTASFTVSPGDVTAPVTTHDAPAGWVPGPVSVHLSATDAGSGVDSIRFSLDATGAITYVNPIQISVDGSHTLDYSAMDFARNREATKTATVLIDSTPPVTTATPAASYTAAAAIPLSATDALSGVAGTAWRVDAGTWTTSTVAAVAYSAGRHVLEFRSTDLAGNTEGVRSVNVDMVSLTRFEQSDSRVTYSGPWATSSSSSLSGGSYASGYATATALVKFDGTAIDLIGTKSR